MIQFRKESCCCTGKLMWTKHFWETVPSKSLIPGGSHDGQKLFVGLLSFFLYGVIHNSSLNRYILCNTAHSVCDVLCFKQLSSHPDGLWYSVTSGTQLRTYKRVQHPQATHKQRELHQLPTAGGREGVIQECIRMQQQLLLLFLPSGRLYDLLEHRHRTR